MRTLLRSPFFWSAVAIAWLTVAFIPVIPWYKGGTFMGYWPLYVVYFGGAKWVLQAAAFAGAHLLTALGLAAWASWLRRSSLFDPGRCRLVLLLVFLAGLVASLLVSRRANLLPALAVFVGGLGMGQLLYAIMLARRAISPGSRWGTSPIAQAMQGMSSLLLSVMVWAGRSLQPSVGWAIGTAYLLLFLLGHRLEHRARQHGSV